MIVRNRVNLSIKNAVLSAVSQQCMLRAAPDCTEFEEAEDSPSEFSIGDSLSDVSDDSDTPDDTASAFAAAASGDVTALAELPLTGLSGVTAGLAPVQIATINGHLEVVQYLINKVSAEIVHTDPPVAHLAAMHGHTSILEYLHSLGVSLAEEDPDGSFPALEAAAYGQVEVLQLLSALNTDLTKGSQHQNLTVAHQAASHGYPAVLQFCVEACIPLYSQDSSGRTALTIARSNVEACEDDEIRSTYQACVDLLVLARIRRHGKR